MKNIVSTLHSKKMVIVKMAQKKEKVKTLSFQKMWAYDPLDLWSC